MSFKTLGEALESALASALNGEEGAATPSVSRKMTGAVESPGPVTGLRQREEKSDGASRERMNAALPIGRKRRIAPGEPHRPEEASPRPAVRRFLLIEGGRTETGGNASVRPFAASPQGRAREWLKLVHSAGSLSETG
jgi:hypothetical protein